MTNGSGYFSLSLNLKAADDNATTYIITSSFEDNSTVPNIMNDYRRFLLASMKKPSVRRFKNCG
jgi:hypothetical protein